MNKKVLSFFTILLVLFIGTFYYTDIIQKPMISALNSLKTSYHFVIEFVETGFSKHFFQANRIAILNAKLQQYENNHLVMQELASEINDIFKNQHASFNMDSRVELVRVISYQKFGDFNRIWMDIEDYNSSKIYGLTYKEYVAGIVIPKNDTPLALLNGDPKSTYTVSLGKQHAPGIAHGNNDKNLIVKFIPSWFNIKIGDEVITSGLDNIFFKGLKVGKVLSVTKSQGYQNAIVEQYYKANDPNYFYMIRSVK